MLSTNFVSPPVNIDQSYCMFNQETLKMECMENINLRWVGQECANPLQIGRLKAYGHDGKCLSFGWGGGHDDARGPARFEYCSDTLEQNIVFCDDGTIRSVADDSRCLTIPTNENGDYDFKMKPCRGGHRQQWSWDEVSARDYTNELTGNTWTARILKSGKRYTYARDDGTEGGWDQCLDTYSGSWISAGYCSDTTKEWTREEDVVRQLFYVVPTGTPI